SFGSATSGTTVNSGDADINLGTTGLYAVVTTGDVSGWDAFWYWDLDGDGTFNNQDIMYLDTDGAAATDPSNPEINHVRLSSSDVSVIGGGGVTPTQTTATTTPTGTQTTPTESPADTTETTEPTGTQPTGTQPTGTQPTGTQPTGTDPTATETDDNGAPGLGLIGVLAALGVALVLLRRRS
ncbi:MAG: LPXTG cell wall anchor domain-containing protein, partial [Euryarchaeota archaeon]|nr:LPXTG cell wall anchor domain-containing protein [Euryarchaeota archaeon]